jgi:hypothetical protein
VVDLGGGSGLWARELAQAGYRVLGIGISEAVISTVHKGAREGCPRPSSGSPRCSRRRSSRARPSRPSARSSITSSIHATTSRRWHVSYLRVYVRVYVRVYEALASGGVFVIDVAEPGRSQGGAGADTVGNRDPRAHRGRRLGGALRKGGGRRHADAPDSPPSGGKASTEGARTRRTTRGFTVRQTSPGSCAR